MFLHQRLRRHVNFEENVFNSYVGSYRFGTAESGTKRQQLDEKQNFSSSRQQRETTKKLMNVNNAGAESLLQ